MADRFTMRCGVCDRNYPYHPRWARCSRCGEPTAALRFLEGNADPIMTEADAAELVALESPSTTAPAPKPSRLNRRRARRQLRRELDDWARKPPSWLR